VSCPTVAPADADAAPSWVKSAVLLEHGPKTANAELRRPAELFLGDDDDAPTSPAVFKLNGTAPVRLLGNVIL
jgi:hypothetical protein